MKKTTTVFLAVVFLVLSASFSINTYASDHDDNQVCYMSGVFDWFKRVPSDTEPFYEQRGNYIYTGDTLELKQYTIDGTLIIEEELKFPKPKTSGYSNNRLRINAKNIIITGDISANNYAQLYAAQDENGRGGNIRIEGTGKLTTNKLEDTGTKGKTATVVSADGDFLLKDNSQLEMNSGTVIHVSGDFVADSKKTSELQRGIIEIGGSVDLNKKFISKKEEEGQNTIYLYYPKDLLGSNKRVIKGTSDSRIDNLQLDYEVLKGLRIKKKLFNKSFLQCNSLFFDYQSHFMPKDIIDKYYIFEEIHGKSEKNNQIIDYAKSFFYTIIYTNKLGKVNINKTFLHVEGSKDEKASIYTIDIKEKPTSIAVGNKVHQAKITLEFTGVGKPIKMGSAAFARMVIKLQNGETYDYLVVSKIETINEDAFIESLKKGASEKIKDLAKDILMDQVISDLLDVSTICEWKKGIVTAKIGQGIDFLQDFDDLLQDWNKMVKGLPEYEGKDIEPIQGKEEHVKAAPETIDDSSEKVGIEESEIEINSSSDEYISKRLNEFLSSKETMYGKSCTYTVARDESNGNNNPFEMQWDGISVGVILGYSIEDFDDDGNSELLLITLVDDYRLQLEMYEVINREVTLAASKYTETDSSYGAIKIPNGRDLVGELCGVLSCFVQESNHRIYIHSSDAVHKLGEGTEVFIASIIYENGTFSDYKVSYAVGSDPEGVIEEKNQELSDQGVPNPDFENIFYRLRPLKKCFNEDIHEILYAEQSTIKIDNEDTIMSIISELVFKSINDICSGQDNSKDSTDDWVLRKSSRYYYDNEEPTSVTEFEYDQVGHLIKKSSDYETCDYTYRVGEIECIHSTGEKEVTQIDEHGNPLSIEKYNSEGALVGRTEYIYGPKLLQAVKAYSADGELRETIYYFYNNEGNIAKEEDTHIENDYTTTTTFSYNEQGLKVEEKFTSREPSADYVKQFEYDEYGNCTLELMYPDGAPGAIRIVNEYVKLSD